MLPSDSFTTRKNNHGLTLEGLSNKQFFVLATSLETVETVSMRTACVQSLYRFAIPKTKKGGVIITEQFNIGNGGIYETCFIFVKEDGEVDLKHHWIPEIEDVLCSIVLRGIKRSEGYCLKIKVGDNIYLSDAAEAKSGEYIVSDTKLLCQFLIGEVEESALIAEAEKQVEQVSLQKQFEELKLQHDHNLHVIDDYSQRLDKTTEALNRQEELYKLPFLMAQNILGYIEVCLTIIPKKPWTEKRRLVRKGLEEALKYYKLMLDLQDKV